MAEVKKPSTKISQEEISKETVMQADISSIISQTVSATFKALEPYLRDKTQKPQNVNYQVSTESLRASIISNMNKEFDRKVNENKKFLERMANVKREELVPYRIPSIYRKHIGTVLPVSLNGSIITIPVNNRTYMIPKYYKPIIDQMLRYEDEKQSFMTNNDYSDVHEGEIRNY